MADTRSIIGLRSGATNTPSIASAATALAANTNRSAWLIQNLGTNPLFVLLASGASTTVFHFILKAGAVNDDGNGGLHSEAEGIVWGGIVTIAGTTPRYTVLEIT